MLLKTLTPELFYSLLPELWTRYFAVGEPRVVKVGRGYGRLEITNVPDAFLARSVAIAGYLDQALRMAGAADVDMGSLPSPVSQPCSRAQTSWSRSAVQITGRSTPDSSSHSRETSNGRQCSKIGQCP